MIGSNINIKIFTDKEKSIIVYKNRNMNNSEIALKLNVSRQYIATLTNSIFKKVLQAEANILYINSNCFTDLKKNVLEEWIPLVADIIDKKTKPLKKQIDKNGNVILVNTSFAKNNHNLNTNFAELINTQPTHINNLAEKLNVNTSELKELLTRYYDKQCYIVNDIVVYFSNGRLFQAINNYAKLFDDSLESIYIKFNKNYAKNLIYKKIYTLQDLESRIIIQRGIFSNFSIDLDGHVQSKLFIAKKLTTEMKSTIITYAKLNVDEDESFIDIRHLLARTNYEKPIAKINVFAFKEILLEDTYFIRAKGFGLYINKDINNE